MIEMVDDYRTILDKTEFVDSTFMTKTEKKSVFKDWMNFILDYTDKNKFTPRLYKHLTVHCSFIAYYDINGFYNTYFIDPEDTLIFFREFEKFGEYEKQYPSENYADLTTAMIEFYKLWESVIKKQLLIKAEEQLKAYIEQLQKRYNEIEDRLNKI